MAFDVRLKDGWEECERGNTLLHSTDSGGFVAWFALPGTARKLEITFNPGNYPAVVTKLLSVKMSSDRSLAKHINENLYGWVVAKCSVAGVNTEKRDGTFYVVRPEDPVADEDFVDETEST